MGEEEQTEQVWLYWNEMKALLPCFLRLSLPLALQVSGAAAASCFHWYRTRFVSWSFHQGSWDHSLSLSHSLFKHTHTFCLYFSPFVFLYFSHTLTQTHTHAQTHEWSTLPQSYLSPSDCLMRLSGLIHSSEELFTSMQNMAGIESDGVLKIVLSNSK